MAFSEREIRRGLRTLRREVMSYVDEINSLCKKPISSDVSAKLPILQERLCDSENKYNKSIRDLLLLLDDSDPNKLEKEEVDISAEQHKVNMAVVEVLSGINKYRSSVNRESILNSSVIENVNTNPSAKLPKIAIPKFDGDYRKFMDFKSLYENLIHNETNIPPVQKLYYLKESLVGEASSIIKDIGLSAEAYELAWSRVVDRYENKRLIIRLYFTDLFSIKRIKTDSELCQLLDRVDLCLKGLQACGESTESWSSIICYLVTECLDDKSREDFENSISDNSIYPKFETLTAFLKTRATSVEFRKNRIPFHERKFKSSFTVSSSPDCFVCKGKHLVIDCSGFRRKSPLERLDIIKRNRRCFNCFAKNHNSSTCSAKVCKICRKKHNTLLHLDNTVGKDRAVLVAEARENIPNSSPSLPLARSSLSCANLSTPSKTIILPSAFVKFRCNDIEGTARILMDSCSQPTLMSDDFVKKFRLPTFQSVNRSCIKGVGNNFITTQSSCSLTLMSRISAFHINVTAEVIPSSSIAYTISNLAFKDYFYRIQDFELADKAFCNRVVNIPKVDLVLGAEYYEACLLDQTRKVNNITLRNTRFGWTISGPVSSKNFISYSNFVTCSNNLPVPDVDALLRKFWEIETINENSATTVEERECVTFFEENYYRDCNGQFVIRLPFKNNYVRLTNNRNRVLSHFLRNERKGYSNIKAGYIDFLREYKRLGHMSVSEPRSETAFNYFMPHRAVLRPDSSTTRLRVVFNASAKTDSGFSLNDVLMIGPCIQPTLAHILIKFRTHNVAFSADIEKMYRCVLVHPDDRCFQKILWRENSDEDIQEFTLNTVTYGTAPASFLVTKCLEVLSNTHKNEFADASRAIKYDFYMDDLLTGAKSVETAVKLRTEIHDLLATAGFRLRKYNSNSPELLRSVSPDLVGSGSLVHFKNSISVLGLIWNPISDNLCVKINTSELPRIITKRILLSSIARIFDPLGLISPVTIRAKIIIQRVWKLGIDWDDPVSLEVDTEFRNYHLELASLNSYNICRRYTNLVGGSRKRLLGFSDASERAFCAVVYLYVENESGEHSCSIVCAKTKVAPFKDLTIPKLELEAASLLAKLICFVREALNVEVFECYCFTDSQIVLSWLAKPSQSWKTFVANRVSRITATTSHWFYINSKDNPADLATRGLQAQSFLTSELWIYGPSVSFSSLVSTDNRNFANVDCQLELRKMVSAHCILSDPSASYDISIVNRFSSYMRLLRVVALILRFVYQRKRYTGTRSILTSNFSVEEYDTARNRIIRLLQRFSFKKDYVCIEEGRNLSKGSPLKRLTPFLDSNGIIRLSGRLTNANISYDRKHPVILPGKCHFISVYVRHLHEKYFHANRTLLANLLASQFYCIGGVNRVIKRVVYDCVVCIRYRCKVSSQLMADLPRERVSVSRPFSYVGVDLAGPFDCQCTNHRTRKLYKICVAIFVCFATKAVHLEIVSSLSSDAFLNCFQRFVSRRGRPNTVYSDNATNFVGTKNYLEDVCGKVQDYSAEEKVKWRFIPARSPHRGGLWEAAVKSAKYHLVRTLKGGVFDYEGYNTIFARIESILNSRPLCYKSLSTSGEVLTPGHFLIGNSLISLPEDERSGMTFLKRYLSVRNRVNAFWHSWSKDYLSQLQVRNKWFKKAENLRIGSIVLLKEDNLKPGQFKLGKVEEVFPDKMGNVRTVKVWVDGSSRVRPTCSLIPLPADEPVGSSGGE